MRDDFDEQYKRLEERLSQPKGKGGLWHWVTTVYQGRRVILGPYDTEEKANAVGFEKLENNYEVVELPTRDRARATQQIRHRYFEKGDGLDTVLKRMMHKAP